MSVLKIVMTILFILDSIFLAVVVLMQEGKEGGLSAVTGSVDSYWKQNKGRSMEGALVKITRVAAVLFMVLTIVLNMQSL